MINWTRDVGASVYNDVVSGSISLDNNGSRTVDRTFNGIPFRVHINTGEDGNILVGSVYPIG